MAVLASLSFPVLCVLDRGSSSVSTMIDLKLIICGSSDGYRGQSTVSTAVWAIVVFVEGAVLVGCLSAFPFCFHGIVPFTVVFW